MRWTSQIHRAIQNFFADWNCQLYLFLSKVYVIFEAWCSSIILSERIIGWLSSFLVKLWVRQFIIETNRTSNIERRDRVRVVDSKKKFRFKEKEDRGKLSKIFQFRWLQHYLAKRSIQHNQAKEITDLGKTFIKNFIRSDTIDERRDPPRWTSRIPRIEKFLFNRTSRTRSERQNSRESKKRLFLYTRWLLVNRTRYGFFVFMVSREWKESRKIMGRGWN